MKTNVIATTAAGVSPAGRALKVLVVYENVPARTRIQRSCWLLMRELSGQYNFDCFWYGFNDLKHPRVAGNARAAAANADIILFSVSADTAVPPEVRKWVESWIESKSGQDTALAALLNQPRSRKRRRLPVWSYLSEIARRAGMSFLPEIHGPAQWCAQAA